MKTSRPKTEKYHNYEEGDCGKPINNYFKRGFWKRNDRKKFIKNFLKILITK
jgi:hypothetical protein